MSHLFKFICQLQEDYYGTVSEQISTLKNLMPHYMKPEITDTKLSAIDNILTNKQQQNNSFKILLQLADYY